MNTTLEPEELLMAGKVAQRIGSKWTAVDVDDLTGHLYLWLVNNPRHVSRWRNENGGQGKLYVTLKREAAKYCAHEQAVSVGRPITADNFYTPELLSRALPYVFEDVPQSTAQVNPRTGQSNIVGNEFDNALAIMADIKGAFYGLQNETREILEWRFRDGLTYEEIGELRKITKDGAKKSVDRAVSRLSDSLSGEPL